MQSFWQTLPKPIIGLAPMDGVTDHPFRYIQKKYGNPAIVYTEFVNVEGLCYGATNLLEAFHFDGTQRPIIAQIYGNTLEYFRDVAILCCTLGFDGIDINMGCPAKKVAHRGAGAGLIRTPKLAQEIIAITKEGVQEYLAGKTIASCEHLRPKLIAEVQKLLMAKKDKGVIDDKRTIPVSVKTRVGYSDVTISEWVKYLLEAEPEAIAVHGRTLKQMYKGNADWDAIGEAVQEAQGSGVLILGNGDVKSYEEALEKVVQYGVDGVLLGRAAEGNPFLFSKEHGDTFRDKVYTIALEHALCFEETYRHREKYRFVAMRRHLANYVKSVRDAAKLRALLVRANSSQEVKEIFTAFSLPFEVSDRG